MAASSHQSPVAQIINDIESGRDLRKYLSRGIEFAAQVPGSGAKLNRRRDLDLLLTSWQIHHLHLSTTVEDDGFVSRTDDLLFAVFRQNDAFLVDIVPHGGWYQDNLLRILMNELPGSGVVLELRGVQGLSREPEETDIKTLRNAGINMAHMIDGKAVISAGGVSTAGTSERATRDADILLDQVEQFQQTWVQQPNVIRALADVDGVTLPEIPNFEFIITEHGPGIYESTTGLFFKL